jgi:hypothetical protein
LTDSTQQGREQTPLCPRCHGTIEETNAHCLVCPNTDATNTRTQLLHSFLLNLEQCHTLLWNTNSQVHWRSLTALNTILHMTSHLTKTPQLLQAILHQNILGWDMLLKGFTSAYWTETQKLCNKSIHFCPRKINSLVICSPYLTQIWKDRPSKTWLHMAGIKNTTLRKSHSTGDPCLF